MSDGQVLIGYDVDAIRDYVFGGLRVRDVVGASRIVERFADLTRELAGAHGGRVIFTGGGNGLFAAAGANRAAELAAAIEQRFADETAGAGSCSTAWIERSGDFAADRRRLLGALARAKRERWLRTPTLTLIEGETPCEGCGLEPADRTDQAAGGEAMGAVCARRRDEASRAGRSLNVEEQLFGQPGQSLIACVYLDADRAGERFAALDGPDELGALADALRDGVRHAERQALDQIGLHGRTISPVVGGDDLVIFCPAGATLTLVSALWDALDARLASGPAAGVEFSCGAAVAPSRTPLRLLYDEAYRALRRAKEHRRTGPHPRSAVHLTVASLGVRLLDSPGEDLFAGPIPRDALPDVRRLIESLTRVNPSQRAGIVADLQGGPEALSELNLEVRAERDPSGALRDVLARARRLASSLGRPLTPLLVSALVAHQWLDQAGNR